MILRGAKYILLLLLTLPQVTPGVNIRGRHSLSDGDFIMNNKQAQQRLVKSIHSDASNRIAPIVPGASVELEDAPPSSQPTTVPSNEPSAMPSRQPTSLPSIQPSSAPSIQPTGEPSSQPSSMPSDIRPSNRPSSQPTTTPTDMVFVSFQVLQVSQSP